MKIAVLDAASLGEDLDLSVFERVGGADIYKKTTSEELYKYARGYDAIVINKVKVNPSTLPVPTDIKLICITATGFDNVDLDFCRANGIAVTNVVGYSTDSVAQITVSMALSLASHLPEYNRFVRSGEYTKSGIPNRLSPPFHELSGKTWGIVGYGNIGKKVAAIAEAIGCKVIVCKRTKTDDLTTIVDIDTLCEQSDIISLHTPLTSETRGMISTERIAKMKKRPILINVARGAVADEEALAEAIENGNISALGVDVYSTEPMGEEHPLFRIKDRDNVCLTPHMAWGAVEARERCMDEVIENIISYQSGGTRCRVDIK